MNFKNCGFNKEEVYANNNSWLQNYARWRIVIKIESKQLMKKNK